MFAIVISIFCSLISIFLGLAFIIKAREGRKQKIEQQSMKFSISVTDEIGETKVIGLYRTYEDALVMQGALNDKGIKSHISEIDNPYIGEQDKAMLEGFILGSIWSNGKR